MAMLGWALVQLLASGMYTWRSGEMRRGAYERAQFVFDRVSRDLAGLYPHNPPMRDAWTFQVDTLFSANYDGTGEQGVVFTLPNNISLIDAGGVRHMKATNPGAEAWVEYQFTPGANMTDGVVQPKIKLVRSAACVPTCQVIVEASNGAGAYTEVARFTSGLRDETITPNVDISPAGALINVRIRIVPEPGQQSDALLFEAAKDDPVRPVFRVALSPRACQSSIGLVSDYRDDGSQYLVFVKSARGLKEVAYFVDGETLYRVQRDPVGGPGSLFTAQLSSATANATPVAKGIAYFGCEFVGPGGSTQAYWREARSVPPGVALTVATVPISGAKIITRLKGALSASDPTLRVESTKLFITSIPLRQFVKIDQEWISYERLERDGFIGCLRGERGTLPAAHSGGSIVVGPETFYVDIPIAAWGYRNR